MEKKFRIIDNGGKVICDNIINIGVAVNLYLFVTDHYTDDLFTLEAIPVDNVPNNMEETQEDVETINNEAVDVIDED